MEKRETTIFGIDLGTTYSCIAYVDEFSKPTVVPNLEGQVTTPSVVQFEGESRVVGVEAKNNAVLHADEVVEMVKRHMGKSDWIFRYEERDYVPEEISSYILRKVVNDASQQLGRPITDVVITCPAYFGIAEREATARAGEIAGLNVWEIINEPTAAAINYGLQEERDQVVLVYDLGGGTFDITMIEIKAGAITVVATGGDHELGGRDWDERVVNYLAQEVMSETGSSNDPTGSSESLQELWQKAEQAKFALTQKPQTQVAIFHEGQHVGVTLTREKFEELTASLLESTITYTRDLLADAKARGHGSFDQILLVGGSTRMPQVKERLIREFGMEPKVFDPDQAVAKGAAIYGQTLSIGRQIQHKIAEKTGAAAETVNMDDVSSTLMEQVQQEVARESGYRIGFVKKAQETVITNVASHSFGVIVLDGDTPSSYVEIISNLVVKNDPLPRERTETYFTVQANQETVKLQILENLNPGPEERNLANGKEIAQAVLDLPANLPDHAPIEVTFELNQQGRLHVIGREPRSRRMIEATVQTAEGRSEEEVAEMKARASRVSVS